MEAFDLQPTLTGETLELRPLREGDYEALFAVARDRLIWEQHPAWNRYKRNVFKKFFAGALASKGAFAVLERASGEIVGSSRYYDLAEGEVAVGFTFLKRRLWGGRCNAEMKALMLGHAFRFMVRVVFHVGMKNLRSRRAVEKLGAKLVGLKPGDSKSVAYALTRRG